MNRRKFIKSSGILFYGGAALLSLPMRGFTDVHREIFDRTMQLALERNLVHDPVGDVVVEIGRSFLQAPYEAFTLEQPGEERLVINLRSFDCVTLVENALALARCIKKETFSFEDFTRELTLIRYRSGVIDGYASRLNYFTDWIYDNEQKGIVRNVTGEIGGEEYRKEIRFMSTNRNRYARLSDDRVFEEIKYQEAALNEHTHYFLPKGNFHMAEASVRNGDVLAFTTNLRGLDIMHTAIAIGKEGRIHLLHAPDTGRTVEMTVQPVADYMAKNPRVTGIMAARPLEI